MSFVLITPFPHTVYCGKMGELWWLLVLMSTNCLEDENRAFKSTMALPLTESARFQRGETTRAAEAAQSLFICVRCSRFDTHRQITSPLMSSGLITPVTRLF